jgi:hypothetical protein
MDADNHEHVGGAKGRVVEHWRRTARAFDYEIIGKNDIVQIDASHLFYAWCSKTSGGHRVELGPAQWLGLELRRQNERLTN